MSPMTAWKREDTYIWNDELASKEATYLPQDYATNEWMKFCIHAFMTYSTSYCLSNYILDPQNVQ